MAVRTIHSEPRSVKWTAPLHLARSGITLVEVLLALALTGLIAASVAAMLYTLSYGTTTRNDLRRQNTKSLVLRQRLDVAIRSAKAVLAADSNYVVLWTADLKRNQKPDLSELHRIEWNSSTQQLTSYAAPANLADADNTTYELTVDFAAVTKALKGTPSFPGDVYGTGIASAAFHCVSPAQDAKWLSYSLALPGQEEALLVSSTVALRSR